MCSARRGTVDNMRQRKLNNLGVSTFCESMSMMMKSGIQTDEAIALLRQGDDCKGPLEQALSLMQKEAERGRTLSDVMDATNVFPAYAVRMAAAGETVGRLDGTLTQLAKYYVEQNVIGEKLKNAAVYPAVMLLAAVAALTAMLSMVLPAFTDVYQNLAGSLTSSSYQYIGLAYKLCWASMAVMGLLGVFALICFILWQGNGGRRMVENLLGKLPLCAPVMESLGLFRFTSALTTYLVSGATQDLAMAESMNMVFHKQVEERIRRCAAKMEEGHGIAQAAYDERLFEPVYGRMLLAGERSGSLEEVLQKLTGLLEEHCMEMIDRLIGVVNPLLSGILILAVGFSLLGAMLPLIGIMNAVG